MNIICSYSWTVNGVEEETTEILDYTFDAVGIHTVCLEIVSCEDTDCIEMECYDIDVLCNVSSGFTYSGSTGVIQVGEIITFTNTSIGNISDSYWDFGNGTTSSVTNPNPVTYTNSGFYEVCLTSTSASAAVCQDQICFCFRVDDAPILAVEDCTNGIDDDGDGLIDCFDPDCCGTNNTICDDNYYNTCVPNCEQEFSVGEFELNLENEFVIPTSNAASYQLPIVANIDCDPQSEIVVYDDVEGDYLIFDGESMLLEHTFNPIDDLPGLKKVGGAFSVAIADLDPDDGTLDIVLAGKYNYNDYVLICYSVGCNVAPTFKWVSDPANTNNFSMQNINVADFNGDGKGEVYSYTSIFNGLTGEYITNGNLTFNQGTGIFQESTSVAMDVLDDDYCPNCKGMELVVGHQVYSVNIDAACDTTEMKIEMEMDWSWPNLAFEGVLNRTSIADFDGDGDLDAIVSERVSVEAGTGNDGRVYAWDIQTNEILCEMSFVGYSGRPTVANFDNDPEMEIGLWIDGVMNILDCENGLFTPIPHTINYGDISNSTGIIVFDFNGDGRQEIVFRNETNLLVFQYNETLEQFETVVEMPCYSITAIEHPIIVDVDSDGETELICGCLNYLSYSSEMKFKIFSSNTFSWVSTRNIWNQYNYFSTNINDDLTLPIQQQQNQLVLDSAFNAFPFQYPIINAPLSDATIDSIGYVCEENDIEVTVKICNIGEASLNDETNVSFYSTDPFDDNSTGELLISVELQDYLDDPSNINVDDCVYVTVTLPDTTPSVYVVVNDNNQFLYDAAGMVTGTLHSIPYADLNGDSNPDFPVVPVAECDYTNNTMALTQINCSIVPPEPCALDIDFSFSSSDVEEGELISLTPIVSDSNISYSWNFGDGNSSTEMMPNHAYADQGAYQVCLTATSISNPSCVIITCEWITIKDKCRSTWMENFSPQYDNEDDYGICINELNNGSYFVSGIANSFATGNINVRNATFIINESGELISSEIYTSINDIDLKTIMPLSQLKLSDGSILVASQFAGYDGPGLIYGILISKYDENGVYLWTRRYSSSILVDNVDDLIPVNMFENANGDIVLLLSFAEENKNEFRILIFSPDGDVSNMDETIYQNLNNTDDCNVTAFSELTGTGDYLLAGVGDFSIARLDHDNNNFVWKKNLDIPLLPKSILINEENNEILIFGHLDAASTKIGIISLDFNGNENWSKVIEINDAFELDDAGMFLFKYLQAEKINTGYVIRINNGSQSDNSEQLIRLDQEFNLIKTTNYSYSNYGLFVDMDITSNNDIVFTGVIFNEDAQTSQSNLDIQLLKTDHLGMTFDYCGVEVFPTINDLPIVISNSIGTYNATTGNDAFDYPMLPEQKIFLENVICNSDCCSPISETEWIQDIIDQNLLIDHTITIPNGTTVTIDNSLLRFTPNGKIEVSPTAHLIITNNSILTQDTKCDNIGLWQGIELLGQYSGSLENSNTGSIVVENGSTIEYATTAIYIQQAHGLFDNLINVSNSYFFNNTKGIFVEKANYRARLGFSIINNIFAHNNMSYPLSTHHIFIKNTRINEAATAVAIIDGNTFENAERGIYTYNMNRTTCTISNNSFKGMEVFAIILQNYWGDAISTQVINANIVNGIGTEFFIENNVVKESKQGFRLLRTRMDHIIGNDIEVSQNGLILDNVVEYEIINNDFKKTTDNSINGNGLRLFNSYLQDHLPLNNTTQNITGNSFTDFSSGLIFRNYETTVHSVNLNCNTFQGNKNGISVVRSNNNIVSIGLMTPNSDINIQGSSTVPAYNVFLNNSNKDINVSGANSNLDGYWYPTCTTCSDYEPTTIFGNIGFNTAVPVNDTDISCGTSMKQTEIVEDNHSVQEDYQLSVFPNPNSGRLTIQIDTEMELGDNLTLSIYDLSGKLIMDIYQGDLMTNTWDVQMSHLPSGVYLLKAATSKDLSIEKIVLSK